MSADQAELEARIERETAEATRLLMLRQGAHDLAAVRRVLKTRADLLAESGSPELAERLRHLIVNELENIAWSVEQALLEGKR